MNYKDLYMKLLHASEDAVKIITQAQRECEELYAEIEENEEETP